MDILTSRTVLDYPIYACDFDPADAGQLVVGGGAGARKSDGNKITLLNTSSPTDPDLSITAELRLPREEDNITSLAAGPHRGRTTIAFAGINSSPDDLKKGKNEHFRVFGLDGASSKNPKISEVARASFFTPAAADPAASSSGKNASASPPPDLETYQRIVRVSAPFPDGNGSTLPQIGACATDMSRNPQIVVFDVNSAAPAAAAAPSASSHPVLPKVRGRLELAKDVQDLDVIQTDADKYQLAYCTTRELYLFDISTKAGASANNSEPVLVYDMPLDKGSGAVERPAFHSIRYLTPNFILASCNLPRRTGVLLVGLRLPDNLAGGPPAEALAVAPAAPAAPAPGGTAASAAAAIAAQEEAEKERVTAIKKKWTRIAVNVKLPKSVTYTTSLAVRNLSPPSAPGARQGETQFVVAVGDANNAISLYTAELQVVPPVELLAKLYPFRTIQQVHPIHITSIQLSHFHPPSSSTSSAAPATQYLRLASVSVGNTVVVHHIPLRKLPSATAGGSSAASAITATGKSPRKAPLKPAAVVRPPPRYVVALKSHGPTGTSLYVFVLTVIALMLLGSQALVEIKGGGPSYLGARDIVPASWLSPAWKPSGVEAPAAVPEGESPVSVAGVPTVSHKADEL